MHNGRACRSFQNHIIENYWSDLTLSTVSDICNGVHRVATSVVVRCNVEDKGFLGFFLGEVGYIR